MKKPTTAATISQKMVAPEVSEEEDDWGGVLTPAPSESDAGGATGAGARSITAAGTGDEATAEVVAGTVG